MRDIEIYEDTSEIPYPIQDNIDTETAATTYIILENQVATGWAQILHHDEQTHELAHLFIGDKYRRQGLGRQLVHYMMYQTPVPCLQLTTISPDFFEKLGFRRMDTLPSFVDYTHPDCQQCHPDRCQAMEFRRPESLIRFNDYPICQARYRQILKTSTPMTCEYSLVNNTMWATAENPYFIDIDGILFIVTFPFQHPQYGVVLPYRHIPEKIIKEFINTLRSLQIPQIKFQTAVSLSRHPLLTQYPIRHDRDNDDYLYRVSDFANYPGKRFEKKRNRLRRFVKENPDHRVTVYTPSDRDRVLRFTQTITAEGMGLSGIHGTTALQTGLDHNLLQGLLVEVNDELVGVVMYSELNPVTAVVHFEFINPVYDGVAQLLNHELGKHLQGQYKFINREQDLGIAGLRQSKLSYRPYRLLKKYDVSIR